jgi:predicted nucleic acid-binding protein
MIVLDSDHLSILRYHNSERALKDLKAACIAMANNALLLTANRRDFEKVPGLRFENWLE